LTLLYDTKNIDVKNTPKKRPTDLKPKNEHFTPKPQNSKTLKKR